MGIAINAQGGRVTFLTGKLPPKRKAARRCTLGNHWGHLVNTAKYIEAGGIYADMGECSTCGSTISRSQLRGAE